MKKIGLVLINLLLVISAQAQTLSLSAGSSFDLIGNKPTEIAVIPLKIDGATTGTSPFIDGPPAYVKFNNSNNGELKNAFSFRYDQQNMQLLITVNNSLIPLQGSYELHIPYNFTKDKGGSLTFTLVRPPAVLENLNKATTINETGGDIQAIPLAIRETGRKTSISDLNVSVYNIPGIKAEQLLSVADTDHFIGAGKARHIFYSVNHDVLDKLPLGPTPFSLYINSNTLQQPLEIPVIVNRSLSKGWIIVTVFLGLLVGFLVKHVLKSKMDNDAAAIIALQLIESIKAFSKDIGDPEVKSVLAGYITAANSAIQNLNLLFNSDPSQTVTAIQTLQASFNQTRTNFQNSLNSQQFAVIAARDVLYDTAILPGVLAYMPDSRTALLRAGACVEARNASGAASAMTDTVNKLLIGINNYKGYWNDLFTFLGNQNNLPADSAGTLTWIATESQKLQTLPASVTSADFSTPMLVWNNIEKQLAAHPDELKVRVMIDFAAKNPVAAKNGALTAALDAWIAMIKLMVENGNLYTDPVRYNDPDLLPAINTAWTQAQTAPVLEDIDFGVRDRGMDDLLEIGSDNDNNNNGSKGTGVPLFKFPVGSPGDDDTAGSLIRARRGYLWYSLIQLLLLTLLIGLGAYKSYDTQFIGTFDQLATIFLVAFSMDVTISSVSQFNAKQTL